MSVAPGRGAPALPRWLEAQLPMFDARRCVQVDDDLTMHVMEATTGASDPEHTVLMVHGNPTWGFLYRRIVAALPPVPSMRCVVPDLVGMGLSSKPRDASVHTLEAHGRWLATLVEALDLRRVTLVCQDWGGAIGVSAFLDQPERLHGLVVLNTVLGPPKKGFRPTAFHRLGHLPGVSDLVFRGLGFPQNLLWAAQTDRASIRGQVARAYRWPLRRLRRNVAPLALTRMVPDSLAHRSVPALQRVQDFVAGFDGPAAIVWGTGDPILGKLHRRAARLLPQASVTLTPAGHFLQEEVPGAIASAVTQVVTS